MNKEKGYQIFGKYLMQYRLVIGMFFLFGGIFMGMFSLYNLEIEAVIYAGGLCILCTGIFLPIHFYYYYKKHRCLEHAKANALLVDYNQFRPSNLIETDLQQIINSLQETIQRENNVWSTERKNSIDYYTTWVHQMKAPIGAMKLMLQGNDTKENQDLLAELFRIEQYTEMVLSYFRLDSTSSDFVFQTYELDKIIRQAIRKFAPLFVRKKIRLVYDGTSEQVLTDEKWLLFMIEQILSNALKYTETGSITIEVTKEKVLKITDTGIGIAAEDLPRIFEKGFTGYNGRANKKSTGLGLYLTAQAADKLSHKLYAQSQVGAYTSISIDLNRADLKVE